MTKQNIQPLKGFRDFLPAEKRQRDFVTGKIKEVFERFGFEPLETPTLEYASLLLGKYGAEADKLIYSFEDRGGRRVALRYDQTVPTARVLAQYQNQLPKYFRRYQLQNVFRADKPQKGRFREFTQCDIDIFGSTSPLADAEILACTYAAYKNIGFTDIKLNLNDRQTLLTALSPFATPKVDVFSIIQSIDKLDKLSPEEVTVELVQKGLSSAQAKKALSKIENASLSSNLQEIVALAQGLGVPKTNLVFNPKLARGLDYYTGMIFEIILGEYQVGSVGGGGRYDELILKLGGMDISAVGVAFGFDRTVEAAVQLSLIPDTNKMGTQVLVTVFEDKNLLAKSLAAVQFLRERGIATELYPAPNKIAKQFKYANAKNIPWVVVIGEDEIKQNKVTLKNMISGQQQLVTLVKITSHIQKLVS